MFEEITCKRVKSNYGKQTDYRRTEINDKNINDFVNANQSHLGRYGQELQKIREILDYERTNSGTSVRLVLIETHRGYYLENVSKQTFHKTFQLIHQSFDLANRVIVDLHNIEDYDIANGRSFISADGYVIYYNGELDTWYVQVCE